MPAPDETTVRQAFLQLLPEQSSDPALPCRTRDSSAHGPPVGHGWQSFLLPQLLLFTLDVKYLHCSNTMTLGTSSPSKFPPGFTFPSSLSYFTDHRAQASSWQELVALAGTAAGLPACPLFLSLPRKFSSEGTREGYRYIILLLRGTIFKYLLILLGTLSSPSNFIVCIYFNKNSTCDIMRKILGIFPEWEIKWTKGILLFLKLNFPQVPAIRNTIKILGWIRHLPSDNDLFCTVFCAAKF